MRTQSLLSFLFESPLKSWKKKQTNLSQEQLTKAKGYFDALTGQLKAYILGIDLTELKFEKVELLYLSILEAKNFGIGAEKGGKWLAKQIDNNPSLIFQNVKEDYIPVLVSYNKNLKKPEIKDVILDNVSDIQKLNSILNSLGSEICITATEAELGKVTEKDGWEVFLPHTTEASIVLGKRYCGKRDNVWCTTREDGKNLFLNYAIIHKVALFYVIKKGQCADRGNPEYKMSVGFINGEPKFDMGSGNITVDADNQNLTFERFQQVLGEELADEFLEIMKQKMGVLGNEPPALKEMEMLVATPKKFKQKFEGYEDNENGDAARKQFADFALESNKTSPEVIKYLATAKYDYIREYVANHPNTPAEAFKILAGDEKPDVREYVALNPNTPAEAFKILAGDENPDVRGYVAKNPNTPREILETLAGDTDDYVREYIAKNPNTPEEAFKILATDKDDYVRINVAQNPNTPEDVLIQLSKDEDFYSRLHVAQNSNAPIEALKILANDPTNYIKSLAIQNAQKRNISLQESKVYKHKIKLSSILF